MSQQPFFAVIFVNCMHLMEVANNADMEIAETEPPHILQPFHLNQPDQVSGITLSIPVFIVHTPYSYGT